MTTALDIDSLLRQAVADLDRSDTPRAEETLAQALALAPENAQVLQLTGLLRRMQGRFPEAEDFYRRSIAIDPALPHVHHNLGNLLKSLGRFDEAVAELREAIRLKPNYAEAHLNLALALSAMGDHAAAETSCRQALRLQPGYLMAKQSLATILIARDRPKEAEQLLRQTLSLGVRNTRQAAAIEYNLGVALHRQQHNAEALALFDTAQARVPDMPAVDSSRGSVLQQLGRLEEAVACYQNAVLRDPLDMAAHLELNQLLYRLGDDAHFLKSYDDAEQLYPQVGNFAQEKGSFLFLRDDYAGARDAFERAVRLLPDSAASHDGLARSLARTGEIRAAIAEHEIATRLAPHDAYVWRSHAQTLLEAGDAHAARGAAEKALALDPENQTAFAMWGLALRLLGDPREEHINDVEGLVRVYEIGEPDGYAAMDDFNRDLDHFLDGLHRDRRECIDQTLRAGTQTRDKLFGAGAAPVELLRARLDDAVRDYIARMPDDERHPLFNRKRNGFDYSASWSSRLRDCGFHTNHVHPKGWISSAYYVAVPEAVEKAGAREGWIKFGEPNLPCGLADPVRRMVKPHPGMLVLFPSYMWHGTVPFHSDQSRTTIAFDVIPAINR